MIIEELNGQIRKKDKRGNDVIKTHKENDENNNSKT